MSDMAKAARAAMKAKAKRLGSDRPLDKVDSSTWTPPEMLNADVKTGLRPVSRRAYKSGGKVQGVTSKANLGRTPRQSGGKALTADSLINRNVKDANQDRDGIKHVGGMKAGGRAKKMVGGPMAGAADMMKKAQETGNVPASTLDSVPATSRLSRAAGLKKGGKVHEDVTADKALIRKMVKPSARTGKDGGGGIYDRVYAAKERSSRPNYEVQSPEKVEAGRQSSLSSAERTLGMKPDEAPDYKRGGRTARATGGRTGKGKTNINIVIAAGKPAGAGDMMPNPLGGPTKPPGMDGGPSGIPVPVPPPSAGGGAPSAMPMPIPMPMPAGGGQPPMPRKSGGRAMSYKDMTAGAGSGEGRLQKTEIAEHQRGARKAGGRTYRSYKDMDAGAGSGLGRLEKTEIQAHKK